MASSPPPPTTTTTIVFAFGTTGDVQPVALLAAALAQQQHHAVSFVTHAQHQAMVQTLWRGVTGTPPCGNLTVVPSPSPPHAPFGATTVEAALRPPAHLQVCLDTMSRACGATATSSRVLLVANLFALEAVHLAEAWGLPLVLAHPYPAPGAMPPEFARDVRRMDPWQYKALKEAEHTNNVSWQDMGHWLWPAFVDSWHPFRQMLGLSVEHLPWLAGRPAPPLFYLYSESILPRPQFYPDHVHVVGYVWPPSVGDDDADTPHAALAALLAESATTGDPGPILVTFGTMVSLGALGDLAPAARTVVEGVLGGVDAQTASTHHRLLVDAAGEVPAWRAALRQALDDHGPNAHARACILEEPVPHTWLLPKCSVVVHHGGSGTTGAALRAGVAQVTVPMMLDQFEWSERVAWLDLGPPPLVLTELFPQDDAIDADATPPSHLLATALAQAAHPMTRLRAAAVGRRLRAKPPGVDKCLALIQAHLADWEGSLPPPKRPSPRPLPPNCELLTLELVDGDDHACSGLTVAALEGSESEVAFLHQEIFPPPRAVSSGPQRENGWGYLKHGIEVKEGDVVLDIGANIGLFILFLVGGRPRHPFIHFHLPSLIPFASTPKDLFVMEEPDQLTIVAVEPAPRTFEALQYNLDTHGVNKHTAIQKAVGASPGISALRFFPHAPGNSTLSTTTETGELFPNVNPRLRDHLAAGAQQVFVEVTTVSCLVKAHGLAQVHLLKIDVEGHEEEALRGIDAKCWPLIHQVVAEVHDVDGRRDRVDALLRKQGFEHVVWETPAWAVAQGEGEEKAMENRMVFARREKKERK